MPLISVLLPTIRGRERWLDMAVTAYRAYADVELLIVRDAPTCGVAWQQAAERAIGDYLAFGADDLEMHPGWWQAAAAVCDRGLLPAPRILNSDGTLQSCGDWGVEMPDGAVPEFTRIPFVSREQWRVIGPMIPLHYFTDNWVTHRGRLHGLETVVCRAWTCTHHLAGEGRLDRMEHDRVLYDRYVRGELPL